MGNRHRLRHEREVRRLVDGYERQATVQKFHELESLSREHRSSHEREHEYTELAIGKATATLDGQLDRMRQDMDRLDTAGSGFMTLERFDREHRELEKKRDEDHESLTKLLAQVGTLRAVIVFLGLPGLAALGWIILAAFSGHAVTGPNGLVP